MSIAHLNLSRFVAPARMINHLLRSFRFVVRGKRGANTRLATVGPGSCGFQHRRSSEDGSEPPKLADRGQSTTEVQLLASAASTLHFSI
jgi:hypothetical protein